MRKSPPRFRIPAQRIADGCAFRGWSVVVPKTGMDPSIALDVLGIPVASPLGKPATPESVLRHHAQRARQAAAVVGGEKGDAVYDSADVRFSAAIPKDHGAESAVVAGSARGAHVGARPGADAVPAAAHAGAADAAQDPRAGTDHQGIVATADGYA
eukprot:ctg_1262.g589